MSQQKTVPLRMREWNQTVSAYAYGNRVYAYDDVAGHYVSVEHLITPAQISYVVWRTNYRGRYS